MPSSQSDGPPRRISRLSYAGLVVWVIVTIAAMEIAGPVSGAWFFGGFMWGALLCVWALAT